MNPSATVLSLDNYSLPGDRVEPREGLLMIVSNCHRALRSLCLLHERIGPYLAPNPVACRRQARIDFYFPSQAQENRGQLSAATDYLEPFAGPRPVTLSERHRSEARYDQLISPGEVGGVRESAAILLLAGHRGLLERTHRLPSAKRRRSNCLRSLRSPSVGTSASYSKPAWTSVV